MGVGEGKGLGVTLFLFSSIRWDLKQINAFPGLGLEYLFFFFFGWEKWRWSCLFLLFGRRQRSRPDLTDYAGFFNCF